MIASWLQTTDHILKWDGERDHDPWTLVGPNGRIDGDTATPEASLSRLRGATVDWAHGEILSACVFWPVRVPADTQHPGSGA